MSLRFDTRCGEQNFFVSDANFVSKQIRYKSKVNAEYLESEHEKNKFREIKHSSDLRQAENRRERKHYWKEKHKDTEMCVRMAFFLSSVRDRAEKLKRGDDFWLNKMRYN